MFPVDLKTKKAEIELPRFLGVKDSKNGNRLQNLACCHASP